MDTLIYILLGISIPLAILTAILNNSTTLGKIVASIFITLGYWILSFIFVFVLYSLLWSIAEKKETVVRTNIYGINKETTTQRSSFIIGCGYIKNEYRYSYYVKYGIDGYKLDDVSAKNSIIIEDEEVKPYIIKYKNVEVIDKTKWKKWLLDVKRTEEISELDDIIKIHVPKGTIVQELRGKL